jgi:hypothetical protein
MQNQNHDEFPKFDHQVLPRDSRRSLGDSVRPPAIPGVPGITGSHENCGKFNVTSGENKGATHSHLTNLRRKTAPGRRATPRPGHHRKPQRSPGSCSGCRDRRPALFCALSSLREGRY